MILLVVVGGYFLLLWAVGGRYHWDVLGVRPLHIPYGDLRSVTSAWECTRRGIDVMAANPCDPYHRSANYPGIWMAPSSLGLGVGDTVALGGCLAAVFFVAVFAVVSSAARAVDALAYGAAVCSPAVMLGVERGNVDILLFALVVLGVLLYRRSRLPFGQAIVLFAAVLKLFPIFAVGAFVRRRSTRSLIGLGVLLAAFAVYCLAILDELRVIWRVTPQPSEYAYGIRICSEWLASHAGIGTAHLRAWDVGLALLVVAAMFLVRGRLRASVASDDSAEQRDVDVFVAGAGIYVLTYVLFRSYEYRLVFLLLAIPQLLRWAHRRRVLAQVSLAALLATLWFDLRPGDNVFGFHTPVALVGLVQLTLFAALICGLITTMSLQQPLSARRTRSDARAARGSED